jgi:hypothetical protein
MHDPQQPKERQEEQFSSHQSFEEQESLRINGSTHKPYDQTPFK